MCDVNTLPIEWKNKLTSIADVLVEEVLNTGFADVNHVPGISAGIAVGILKEKRVPAQLERCGDKFYIVPL